MLINFLILIMHCGHVRCHHWGKLGVRYVGHLLYYFCRSLTISQYTVKKRKGKGSWLGGLDPPLEENLEKLEYPNFTFTHNLLLKGAEVAGAKSFHLILFCKLSKPGKGEAPVYLDSNGFLALADLLYFLKSNFEIVMLIYN